MCVYVSEIPSDLAVVANAASSSDNVLVRLRAAVIFEPLGGFHPLMAQTEAIGWCDNRVVRNSLSKCIIDHL